MGIRQPSCSKKLIMKAEIYSTAICHCCVIAKMLLEKRNIECVEHRIDQDNKLFEKMSALSGGRQSVPQIFLDEKHIGGFDDLVDLDLEGGLDNNE